MLLSYRSTYLYSFFSKPEALFMLLLLLFQSNCISLKLQVSNSKLISPYLQKFRMLQHLSSKFSDLFSYLNHSPSDVTQSHHYRHHTHSDNFVCPVLTFQRTPDSIVTTNYLTPLLQHLIGISIPHFHMSKIQL